MTARVRPATDNDIDAICHLLHNKMNSRIAIESWHRLMSYQWLTEKPDYGRVVDSDGAILGYCGMVYVDRMIGSVDTGRRLERMVSMTSWYLDKSLRGRGLGREMLVTSTADPMLTYATLTNSSKPLAIVESTGFRMLEDHRYLWRKSASADPVLTILDEPGQIRERVDAVEKRLLDDMLNQPLKPFLIRFEGCQSLLFLSIKRKAEHITWYDLMYASDQALFGRCAQKLADVVLPDAQAILAADGRFVQHPSPEAERQALAVPRYYKSTRVAAHEVDHLYSELQLLDLKLD